MRTKRIIVLVLFSAVLVFLWAELYMMVRETGELKKNMDELSNSYNKLTEENASLEKESAFYSDPRNLEKLLRSQFNYKKPGEKMIIVVPQNND